MQNRRGLKCTTVEVLLFSLWPLCPCVKFKLDIKPFYFLTHKSVTAACLQKCVCIYIYNCLIKLLVYFITQPIFGFAKSLPSSPMPPICPTINTPPKNPWMTTSCKVLMSVWLLPFYRLYLAASSSISEPSACPTAFANFG